MATEQSIEPGAIIRTDFIPLLHMAVEFVLIAASLYGGFWLASESALDWELYLRYHVVYIVYFIVLYHNFSIKADMFSFYSILRPLRVVENVVIIGFVCYLVFLSLLISLDAIYLSQAYKIGLATIFTVVSVVAWRVISFVLIKKMIAAKIIKRNILIYGSLDNIEKIKENIQNSGARFANIVGVYEIPESGPDDGGLDRLIADARNGHVDDIVLAMPWNRGTELLNTVDRLKQLPVNTFLSADIVGYELGLRRALGPFSTFPMFEVVRKPISGWSSLIKTLEDWLLASIAILLLAPLLLVIAAAIRLETPGPVLFRQKRLGFNNQEFEIFKFRSMYHCPGGETGPIRQASKGDPRVTRVGRIIRATSLDELPQLFNVLNGTMSLVGPRPHAISHNAEYGALIRGYFARHNVKPGITGWAQVCGLRGETETLDKMEARIRHDVYYVENWSLLFDIRILITTVIVVFLQKTAY